MSEKTIVHWMSPSPPCRVVYAVAKILGIHNDIEWKVCDLMKKDQLSPDFLKINPFHTIPTLVEPDGFILFESRSIARYLIQSRSPDCPLYPLNDLKQRALIDRWLDLDLSMLYRSISDVVYGIFKTGTPNLDKLPRISEVLEMFESYLKQNPSDYVAGGERTLADISTYFTLTLLEPINNHMDLSKFPLISAWNKRMDDYIQSIDQDDRQLATGQENLVEFAKMMLQLAQQPKA